MDSAIPSLGGCERTEISHAIQCASKKPQIMQKLRLGGRLSRLVDKVLCLVHKDLISLGLFLLFF